MVMLLLFSICSSTFAEENGEPESISASQAITALSNRIGTMLQDYFTQLEEIAASKDLIEAVKSEDTDMLEQLAANYQEQLVTSLKVRLYVRDKEQEDLKSSPACGYACVAIVRNSYYEDPPAEALLFRSADANLTLARKIEDANGNTVGSIVAQYPFRLLKNEIEKLNTTGLYTELRQIVQAPITLFSHGEQSIKAGVAQKIIRIPDSKWVIAVWTPGGVTVEEYTAPELPWVYIILASTVLIVGITVLVFYHTRYRKQNKPEKKRDKYVEPPSEEAISYDDEYDDSPTLILGGGAQEVDVSRYLKDTDATQISKKKKKTKP
jgi:hypothetical protein